MVVSQSDAFLEDKDIYGHKTQFQYVLENGFGENRDTLSQAIKAMIFIGDKGNCLVTSPIAR